jgi:hypothetical protein
LKNKIDRSRETEENSETSKRLRSSNAETQFHEKIQKSQSGETLVAAETFSMPGGRKEHLLLRVEDEVCPIVNCSL